jgi:hypothetical protein
MQFPGDFTNHSAANRWKEIAKEVPNAEKTQSPASQAAFSKLEIQLAKIS